MLILIICEIVATFIVVLPINTNGQVFDAMKHDILVKDFATCAGQSDLPNSYENLTLVMEPGTNIIIINGVLVLRETFRIGTLLRITFLKCRTKYPESCVHYATVDVDDICDRLTEDGRMWTEFFKHIDADATCPVAPGKYAIKGAPLDSTKMQGAANMYVGIWRMKMENLYEGSLQLCVEAACEIKKRRKPTNRG